jgi:hypothetical protein
LTLAALPAIASAAGEYEPNDSFITASGPITSGVLYKGTFETSNDIDYYFFYLPTLTQLQFQTTNTTPKNAYVCSEIVHQLPSDTQYMGGSSLSVDEGESESGAVTLEPGKYYFVLSCSGAIGETYSFSLNPPGVTSTYEPFAIACAAAHPPVVSAAEALQKARAKLSAAKLRLVNARRWKARRKQRLRVKIVELRRTVASSLATFNAATENERAACSVPM